MCDVEGQWEWWWKDRVVCASVGVIGMGVSTGEGVCVYDDGKGGMQEWAVGGTKSSDAVVFRL